MIAAIRFLSAHILLYDLLCAKCILKMFFVNIIFLCLPFLFYKHTPYIAMTSEMKLFHLTKCKDITVKTCLNWVFLLFLINVYFLHVLLFIILVFFRIMNGCLSHVVLQWCLRPAQGVFCFSRTDSFPRKETRVNKIHLIMNVFIL